MSPQPHDALVKKTFEDLDSARGELQSVLPAEVSALIAWDTLHVEKGTFVDVALRGRITDLLFSVRLAGREARIYLLFEHQSEADPLMPFRALAYEVRIWEAWRRAHPNESKLPAIVSVLLAQVPGGWSAPKTLVDVIDFADERERAALAPHMPQLTLLVDDLALLTDELLARRPLPETARLALAALRLARDQGTLDALTRRLARWIEALPETEAAQEMLLSVMQYFDEVRDDAGAEEFRASVARTAPHVEDKVMTTWRQLREEGKAEGRAEGKAEGKAEGVLDGQRRTLGRLLRLKFQSAATDAMLARLDDADASTLARWEERILTASTIEEALG